MKNIFIFLIIFGLALGFNALAQEATDQEITAEDLEVSEPKTMPGNFFYGFKNFWRGVKTTFTFDRVKKEELRLHYANERLIEAKKLAEETGKEKLFQRTFDKYQKSMEKIKTRVEKFKDKAKDNPKIDKFLDRFTDKAIKQQILIEKLEEILSHNPEALEKIKAAKEQVLENHSRVIEHLEENKEKVRERLEKNINEIKDKKPILRQRLEQYKEKIRQRIEEIKEEKEEPKERHEEVCVNKCGDSKCQEVVCLGTDCPCAETIKTCPADCEQEKEPVPFLRQIRDSVNKDVKE